MFTLPSQYLLGVDAEESGGQGWPQSHKAMCKQGRLWRTVIWKRDSSTKAQRWANSSKRKSTFITDNDTANPLGKAVFVFKSIIDSLQKCNPALYIYLSRYKYKWKRHAPLCTLFTMFAFSSILLAAWAVVLDSFGCSQRADRMVNLLVNTSDPGSNVRTAAPGRNVTWNAINRPQSFHSTWIQLHNTS